MAVGKGEIEDVVNLLKDTLILQMLALGVSQSDVASIAGVDTHRVNRIGKVVKKARKQRKGIDA